MSDSSPPYRRWRLLAFFVKTRNIRKFRKYRKSRKISGLSQFWAVKSQYQNNAFRSNGETPLTMYPIDIPKQRSTKVIDEQSEDRPTDHRTRIGVPIGGLIEAVIVRVDKSGAKP